jgi:hypothetical protein
LQKQSVKAEKKCFLILRGGLCGRSYNLAAVDAKKEKDVLGQWDFSSF